MRQYTLLFAGLLASCTTSPLHDEVAGSCRLPARLAPVSLADVPAEEVVRDKEVAYHVLALTWSPEWCRARSNDPEQAFQCKQNSFGWVLHGLWPNALSAPHPRYCRAQTAVPEKTVRENLCITPSASLIQHEWAAHGTCGWEVPDLYFSQARSLWNRLARPDLTLLSAKGILTAGDVRAAFVDLNADLPPEAVYVGGSAEGRLREVRICYNLAMQFQPCPADSRGALDHAPITIEPMHSNRLSHLHD